MFSEPELFWYEETLTTPFAYSTSPVIEPEEFLTLSSVAVVAIVKPNEPDEDSMFTEGEKSEEHRFVDPLELVILVNLSTRCLLVSSKVIEPLCDDTVRLRASTPATEIGEESVVITTSLAFSTAWMKIGRLKAVISKLPMLRGKEMVTLITRRGAVMYDSVESPPVEMKMLLSC